MSKEVVAVFSERSKDHFPPPGNFDGIPRVSYDLPERAVSIMDALKKASQISGIKIVQPRDFELSSIYSVHSESYVSHLKNVSERMAQEPPVFIAEIIDPITKYVKIHEYPAFTFPSVFPHGNAPMSTNVEAIKGIYAFDTATPISANTYELALLSAYTALTGAELLRNGKQRVYALSRPPGHHAEKEKAGSYCYFNNVAIATDYLVRKTGSNVAIIDIDAHHGNGTQEIFYESPNVFYGSIHGDPNRIPPYYSGHENEIGRGLGLDFNLNIPLPIGSNDDLFLDSLDILIARVKQFSPRYLVVSLGFDGYKNDPLKIFNLSMQGYAEAARRIGNLELPTLCIQEGGYATQELGKNLINFLKSLSN